MSSVKCKNVCYFFLYHSMIYVSTYGYGGHVRDYLTFYVYVLALILHLTSPYVRSIAVGWRLAERSVGHEINVTEQRLMIRSFQAGSYGHPGYCYGP